jgi:hypothetical protein
MIKPLFVSCCLLLASAVQADTTLNFIAPGSVPVATQLTDRHVRMQMSATQWALYDAEQDTVSIVDDGKKEYSVVDQATVAQLAAVLAEQRTQLQAMLKTMPASQRKQMEQMMGQVLSADSYSPELKDGKGKKTIAGLECKPREVFVNGEHKQSVCVVDSSKLGIGTAELATMTSLFDMFSKMPIGPKQPSLEQFGGVPIEISSPGGGPQQTLVSVSHDSIPADQFTVPAKYFRRSLH